MAKSPSPAPAPADTDGGSPRMTPHLDGHAAAEHSFLDAWTGGRLAHAWLICGPRGIGKATLAWRIIRFVLTAPPPADPQALFAPPPPVSLTPPAGHRALPLIAAGAHPDLKVIERGWADDKHSKRQNEIPVDAVRELGGFLGLTPAMGGWRVVLIDAVDELNRNGANAILKLLEEPPRNALLLLVCHMPGRVLPTIRSRCRKLTLAPLPDDALDSLLARQLPELTGSDRALLTRLADGAPGRALELAAQQGEEMYRKMVALLSSLPRLDVAACHSFATLAGRDETSFRIAGTLLSGWMAAAGKLAAGGTVPELVPGESALRLRLVHSSGLEPWFELWDKVNRLFERTEAVYLDRKQVMVNSFLALERLCRAGAAQAME